MWHILPQRLSYILANAPVWDVFAISLSISCRCASNNSGLPSISLSVRGCFISGPIWYVYLNNSFQFFLFEIHVGKIIYKNMWMLFKNWKYVFDLAYQTGSCVLSNPIWLYISWVIEWMLKLRFGLYDRMILFAQKDPDGFRIVHI